MDKIKTSEAIIGFVGGCLATVAGSVILTKSIKAIKAKTKGARNEQKTN